MIKIEKVDVYGWEAAIRGMRNPLESWSKSDSYWTHIEDPETLQTANFEFFVGKNDLALMTKLSKAGSDHGKFLRFINVTCDITAPVFWVAEHDTYKVATVRNSCSFMHKGVSKPFSIEDFSVEDERIYYLLSPIKKEYSELLYPYETGEYRIYKTYNGREYKVYRNGRIVACAFSYTDNYGKGRTRTFEERECVPSKTGNGYYELSIGGRKGEKWLIHRLVASVWLDNAEHCETVNHINGNKGDNSIENLEWCSREENIKKGFESGLYEKNKLHLAYNSWKNSHYLDPFAKQQIKREHKDGMSRAELIEKYCLSECTLSNMLYGKPCDNEEFFQYAYMWESLIDRLNSLRELYLETKDSAIFKEIRQILPSGYNVRYTWKANYQVLKNIYHARKNHRLKEWREFCAWAETLPYFKEICIEV